LSALTKQNKKWRWNRNLFENWQRLHC